MSRAPISWVVEPFPWGPSHPGRCGGWSSVPVIRISSEMSPTLRPSLLQVAGVLSLILDPRLLQGPSGQVAVLTPPTPTHSTGVVTTRSTFHTTVSPGHFAWEQAPIFLKAFWVAVRPHNLEAGVGPFSKPGSPLSLLPSPELGPLFLAVGLEA